MVDYSSASLGRSVAIISVVRSDGRMLFVIRRQRCFSLTASRWLEPTRWRFMLPSIITPCADHEVSQLGNYRHFFSVLPRGFIYCITSASQGTSYDSSASEYQSDDYTSTSIPQPEPLCNNWMECVVVEGCGKAQPYSYWYCLPFDHATRIARSGFRL